VSASGEAHQADNDAKSATPPPAKNKNRSNTAHPSATNNTDDATNQPANNAVKHTAVPPNNAKTETNHDTVVEQLKTPAPLHMAGGPFQHDTTTGKKQKPIKHGTPVGYQQHRRRNEPACQQCREAHSRATQQRKNRNQP